MFNERTYTAAIFLDVSKACDTVWTGGLAYKLHAAAIPDSSHLLLASYLTDRKFRITMVGKFSEWKTLRADVPQGAILSPLLYNIYGAYIPRRRGIEMSQFAKATAAHVLQIKYKHQLRSHQSAEVYI
jgi:hypothetical protein